VGLSFVLIREKQRYDSLPDKSKFVLFDDIVKPVDKDKLAQAYNESVKLYDDTISKISANLGLSQKQEVPLIKQRGAESSLDGKVSGISPEHVEIAIIPLEYDEQGISSESVNLSSKVGSDASANVEPEIIDVVELNDEQTLENVSAAHDPSQILKDNTEHGDAQEETAVKENVVSAEVLEPATIEGDVKELDQDSVSIVNSENEKEKEDDGNNVIDVKVAFSDESKEKVLDPKVDFMSHQTEYAKEHSTLSGLGKSCMDLGIVLGDLMADVPEVTIQKLRT
jgi:hypothetical protein